MNTSSRPSGSGLPPVILAATGALCIALGDLAEAIAVTATTTRLARAGNDAALTGVLLLIVGGIWLVARWRARGGQVPG